MDWIHQIQKYKAERNSPWAPATGKISLRTEEPVAGLYCLSMGDFEPEIPNTSEIKRVSSGLCSKQNPK